MKDKDLDDFRAGYRGDDLMRKRAHQVLGNELKHKGKEDFDSKSSADKSKMRPYKAGGCVKRAGGGSIDDAVNNDRKFFTSGRRFSDGGAIDDDSTAMRRGGRVKGAIGSMSLIKDMIRGSVKKPVSKKTASDNLMTLQGSPRTKMAAGGVGKIRHKQATSKGAPMSRKAHRNRGV